MEEFDQVAADLEKAIAADTGVDKDLMKSEEALAILKDPAKIKEALAIGVKTMAKAKGAITTDLSQEKSPKDKNVTEDDDEDDDGPDAVTSGRGYRDTRPYVGKHAQPGKKMGKGDDDHDDDHDDDDDDDKPSFFGKKGKKAYKGKKAHKGDDEADADVDATEFMESLGKAMDHVVGQLHDLQKSHAALSEELADLKEGTVIFGQVLADPRRDNLLTTVAKALQRIVTDGADLRKAVDAKQDELTAVLKSIAQMPGMPRAAGLSLAKSEAGGGDPAGPASSKVSEGDKQRLMKARVKGEITPAEWRQAHETGDVSVLQKVK